MRRTVLAVAAAVLASGCGEGVPAIDTAVAESRLAAIVEAAGVPGTETIALLESCPIVDGELLLTAVLDELDGEPIDVAADASPVAFVSTPNQRPDADAYLACGRLGPDGASGAAIIVSDAPGDGLVDQDDLPPGSDPRDQWRVIADSYAARFGDLTTSLDVAERSETRGGILYEICITEPDVPQRDSCELAWFREDLVVSLVVTGPGSDDVALGQATDAFRRRLQLIVDGLAAS